MIARVESPPVRPVPSWHAALLNMLPTVVRYAKVSFRDVDADAREDLVQECVANCLVAFVRLVERGKQSIAYPQVLANYAVRQIKDGRRVGKKANINDVFYFGNAIGETGNSTPDDPRRANYGGYRVRKAMVRVP